MDSPNTMIVRGRTVPAPSEPVQRFFSGDGPAVSRQLNVDELDRVFWLDAKTNPFVTIGRSPDCDISLPHADVSYRHAHFQLVCGHVFCVDLASRTGTYWGAKRRSSGWLMPGKPVKIGPYTISVDDSESESNNSRQVTSLDLLSQEVLNRLPVSDIELVFLNGRHKASGEQSWGVQQPITLVGNSKQCRLRLKDPSVSRVHCSLMATPSGLWVTDLLGRDGTKVNGDSVSFHLLQQGDVLGVGKYRFGVRYRKSATNEPPRSREEWRESGPQQTDSERRNDKPESGAGVSEGFVISMMDRFAAMQQQMSAVNQQQMMFMAQLVGNMHQSHHEVVQQEMARIARISEQIEKLRSSVSARESAVEGVSEASVEDRHEGPRLEAMSPTEEPTVPINQPIAPNEKAIAHIEEVIDESIEPIDEAFSRLPDEAVQLPEIDYDSLLNETNDPGESTMHGFSEDDSEAESEPESEESQKSHAPRYTPADVDNHTDLIERMAQLEKERSSRWKKVMRILTGSGP